MLSNFIKTQFIWWICLNFALLLLKNPNIEDATEQVDETHKEGGGAIASNKGRMVHCMKLITSKRSFGKQSLRPAWYQGGKQAAELENTSVEDWHVGNGVTEGDNTPTDQPSTDSQPMTNNDALLFGRDGTAQPSANHESFLMLLIGEEDNGVLVVLQGNSNNIQLCLRPPSQPTFPSPPPYFQYYRWF